ncbi:MAG: FHA domain-containing protein [Muribaculaceae bacterium]|nr:FHA domain-containing protein [Muribaculaceae bacterium]
MSQNKTVFPGVGPEGDYNPNQGQGYAGGNQAYSRPSNPQRGNGTVYPGMDMPANGVPRPVQNTANAHPRPSGKPIVGFLYSISRTGIGEFWPLHIGQNIIGNSSECDIVLGEGTVSSKHANLHINKMKKPEKTEATISDLGSTNGTLVNESSVSVARPVECVNGDIITIGENYDLLLLLIDTKALGLHLSENFIDVREDDEVYTPSGFNGGRDNTTRNEQDFPPRFNPASTVHPSAYDGGNRPTDSTVGMDMNGGGFRSGGTVGMD